MREHSPSGKVVIPAVGPLDAEIVLVGESPVSADVETGLPFSGPAGKLLNKGLRNAGINRDKVRIVDIVPVRAPKDKFYLHDPADVEWARRRFAEELAVLPNAKVYVAMGGSAMEWLTGAEAKISDWRGSYLPTEALKRSQSLSREDYLPLYRWKPHAWLNDGSVVMPTFHPGAVMRQFDWHPLLINDLQRVKAWLGNETPSGPHWHRTREWHLDDLGAVEQLADYLNSDSYDGEGVIAIDTEHITEPFVVGIATEDAVYVFTFSERYRTALQRIMSAPTVVKVAHNLNHDWTVMHLLGIEVTTPWFDTMGGSHALNNAMDKDLSPGIASRFTNWPYHKWLSVIDEQLYNGMDCIVTYDSYWPMLDKLSAEGLLEVTMHDHQLLPPLLDMQWRGFRIDEGKRQESEAELDGKRQKLETQLQPVAAEIAGRKIKKFEKPHLWQVQRSCECCGGGTVARNHCAVCAGYRTWPERKGDYCTCCGDGNSNQCSIAQECPVHGPDKLTVKELQNRLPACRVCSGSGKITKHLPFNPNSDDQKADLLYRGLSITPRRYKGKETVRVGQLESLAADYPLVASLVDYARVDAEYDTVRRLRPGNDGLLHCVLDPFGTDSGRVAGKEGLLQVGTNPMNIPKDARSMVVPRPGFVFMYPDMAQVEARAIAAETQDPALMALFNTPSIDAHTLVRDDMRGIGLTDFSRNQAKKLEYATFYGARAAQLARELTDQAYQQKEGMVLSEEQTEMAMQYLLSHRFRAIGQWHHNAVAQVAETRYVRSITGRRRWWLGYIYDQKNKDISYEIKKQIWSAVPQDIGAWILGLGLIKLYKEAWDEMKHALVHVHDALLYEVHESIADDMKSVVREALTQNKWGMLFPAEVKVGRNWKEAS